MVKQPIAEDEARLTRYSTQVEVFSDDLLKLTVHWAGCEALTQIQPEILAQRVAWGKGKETNMAERCEQKHTHTHTHTEVLYNRLVSIHSLMVCFLQLFLVFRFTSARHDLTLQLYDPTVTFAHADLYRLYITAHVDLQCKMCFPRTVPHEYIITDRS